MIYYQHNGSNNFEDSEMPTLTNVPSNNALPCSVIVTNLFTQLFEDTQERKIFEAHFEDIDENATFHYIKSFRRVRINFSSPQQAAEARFRMHLKDYHGLTIKCLFTQPIMIGNTSHLEPPKREKQFLISPPASPPVGWEPIEEAEPLINYDLISAVASLAPGESHELHPPSKDQPGIVVHICDEDDEINPAGLRIPQTRRPERTTPINP